MVWCAALSAWLQLSRSMVVSENGSEAIDPVRTSYSASLK
jgi:hypothetical protein